MRQIKFRGRFIKDYIHNEYVAEDEMLYGGYVELDGKPHIVHKHTMGWIMSEVKPESVQQLIGVDANGKEVYEGDTVERIARDGVPLTKREREKTFPMAATFEDYGAIQDEEIIKVGGETS